MKAVKRPGDRIEGLLEELRGMATPPVWRRAEELVQEILELYGAGLRRIVDGIAEAGDDAESLRDKLLGDNLVTSLLLLHGLHPDDLPTRVTRALERVRPHLGSHGGDIEIAEIDEAAAIVRLRMKGSCDGCPSSILTVKMAVETALLDAAPELAKVEVEGVTDGSEPKVRPPDAPPLPFDPAECPAVENPPGA